ncbi:MAG: hypothetical protein Ta2G_00840 [Termitinemataceae bacterium]|nr:MAG: hypothetical protein Ta2G_00840 [Termitinemataceae bacterium]
MKLVKIFFCVLFVSAFSAVALCAQDAAGSSANGAVEKSKFYVVQIPLEKIYPHSKGFVVDYRKNGIGLSRMFLPREWFTRRPDTEGTLKGEIHKLGSGKNWPHVSLFYKDGVLDHLRLYVRREQSHSTWGAYINDGTAGVDENFDNVENIKTVR